MPPPRPGSTLALGMVVTLASVVYAAFRAGSNTALFTLEGSEEGEPLGQVRGRVRRTLYGSTARAPAPTAFGRHADVVVPASCLNTAHQRYTAALVPIAHAHLAPSPLCLNTCLAPLPYTRRPAVQRTALLAAEEGTSAGLDGVPDVAEATREAVTGGPPPPPAGASDEDREAVRLMTTPVTYNYTFFHLIYALASMYIAMLMTGWGSVAQVRKEGGRRMWVGYLGPGRGCWGGAGLSPLPEYGRPAARELQPSAEWRPTRLALDEVALLCEHLLHITVLLPVPNAGAGPHGLERFAQTGRKLVVSM